MGVVEKQRGTSMLGAIFGSFGGFRRKKPAPTQTAGVSGTQAFGGFIDEREDRAELRGRERYRTFSNMLANCSIVAAGVRYYLGLIGKAGWKVEPADDSESANEIADQVNKILFDEMLTPWHRVVRRASMFRFWGFSIQEWTAKLLDDGAIGFLDVEPRPQVTIERWDIDEFGTVLGVEQRAPMTSELFYLPRTKLVYVVDDAINDSPEGLGLFRHMAEGARHLKRYEQLEGWGYETDLRGIPVGRGPFAELERQKEAGDITAQEKDAQEAGIRAFIKNHIKNPSLGLLLDSVTYQTEDERSVPSSVRQWDIDLLSSDATSFESVARAIERINRELARIMGVEQLLLGAQSVGSLALSRDKTQQFGLLVDGSLNELAESFENDLLGPLFSLNGWDTDLMPKLKTESISLRDVNDVTSALKDLAAAGAPIPPGEDAVGEVYDLLGLTVPDLEKLAEDAIIVQDRESAMAEALLEGGNKDGDDGLEPSGREDEDE